MIDLLQVVKIPKKDGSLPLFIEFGVNEQLLPFLVTSTRDLLWVSKVRDGRVKAAIRKDLDTSTLYRDIVNAVLTQSRASSWGSVFPHSQDGLSRARIRMEEYGFGEYQILSGGSEFSSDPLFSPCAWLPDQVSIVIPKDREFLGTLGIFEDSAGSFCALVHNSSRGICILAE